MHLLKNASWFPFPTMSFHSTPFLPSPAGDSWGDSTIKLPSKRQVYPAYKYVYRQLAGMVSRAPLRSLKKTELYFS